MGKIQVQGAESQRAAQLLAVYHMAADGVRTAQQRVSTRHVARSQGLAHRRARHPQAVDLIAHHAGHVKAALGTGGVEHGVVASPARAKAEVVAHQHVAGLQSVQQHVIDKGRWALRRKTRIETQHHRLLDAAACQLLQLVAQAGDARRGGLRLAAALGEEVARVRLKAHHAGRDATLPRLADQQGQHRLVASVYAVEVANGQRTGRRQVRVGEAAKDAHRGDCAGRTRRGAGGLRAGALGWTQRRRGASRSSPS